MSQAFPWLAMVVGKPSPVRLQRPSLFRVLRDGLKKAALCILGLPRGSGRR
jgi:hypothetical protein